MAQSELITSAPLSLRLGTPSVMSAALGRKPSSLCTLRHSAKDCCTARGGGGVHRFAIAPADEVTSTARHESRQAAFSLREGELGRRQRGCAHE